MEMNSEKLNIEDDKILSETKENKNISVFENSKAC